MTQKEPRSPFVTFKKGQLVWLEDTNVKTTHPKAKLTDKHLGPFKILTTTPTNSQLLLPKSRKIHPVFHNSLLTPYKETKEHGPNFTRPPPDIVEGEQDHYKVERIVDSKLSPNKQGILYFVKWVEYPTSKNEWIPASGMKHALDLVKLFHQQYSKKPKPPTIRTLQAQQL